MSYQSLLKNIIEKSDEGCPNSQYDELEEEELYEEELQEEKIVFEELNFDLEDHETKLSFFEYQYKYLVICGGITTFLGALASYYLYKRKYKNNYGTKK